MRISAILGTWICAVFALVCLGVAANGYLSLPEIEDPAQRELASGHMGFWLFLGAVALVFGILSFAMARGKLGAARYD
jgi:hypothetical protein